jgi:hypothetical protein
LHNYWRAIHTGYALKEQCAEFMIGNKPKEAEEKTPKETSEEIASMATLDKLKAWVKADGKEQ